MSGKHSKYFQIPAGVPQGSILSPHLFNIFFNDIPIPLKAKIANYADDTAIFCHLPWKHAKGTRNILWQTLKSVADFSTSWRIKLNSSKTQFSVLTKSTKMIKKLKDFQPRFGGKTFEWNSFVTYLGRNGAWSKINVSETHRKEHRESEAHHEFYALPVI